MLYNNIFKSNMIILKVRTLSTLIKKPLFKRIFKSSGAMERCWNLFGVDLNKNPKQINF